MSRSILFLLAALTFGGCAAQSNNLPTQTDTKSLESSENQGFGNADLSQASRVIFEAPQQLPSLSPQAQPSPSNQIPATERFVQTPNPSPFIAPSQTPSPSPSTQVSVVPVPAPSPTASMEPLVGVLGLNIELGSGGSAGITGNTNNSLSPFPEVIATKPGRNASGVDPKTSFVIRFSEAMDRKSVEDNFVIRSFTQETLTVDNQATFTAKLGALTDDVPTTGTLIWDKDAFYISWNSDDTEVTFTFANELQLPSDEESANTPEYYFSFTYADGILRDKVGNGRYGDYFKLTEGHFEGAVKFGIQTDTTNPGLRKLIVKSNESGALHDAAIVEFSEPMIFYARNRNIAGGLNGLANQAPAALRNRHNLSESISAEAAAQNYKFELFQASERVLGPLNLGDMGGQAVYDANDASHKRVQLNPGQQSTERQLGPELTAGSFIQGYLLYKDGERVSFELPLAGTQVSDLDTALESLFKPNDQVSIIENNISGGTPGQFESGDRYEIRLASGLVGLREINPNSHLDQEVFCLYLAPTGTFSSSQLNAEENGAYYFPGHEAGQYVDLFSQGQRIEIEAAESLLDPAGNQIDTTSRRVSVTVG